MSLAIIMSVVSLCHIPNQSPLASMLNVSPSTISEILRRVERKVFEAYFKEAVPKSYHRKSQPQKAESTEILYRELLYLTTLGS